MKNKYQIRWSTNQKDIYENVRSFPRKNRATKILEAIRKLPTRENSPFNISEEDARIVAEEIAPYWEAKTFHEEFSKSLTEETRKLTYNEDKAHTSRYIVNETASFRSSLQWVHDYEIVMEKGFAGIHQEAVGRLAAVLKYHRSYEQRYR